MLYCRLLSIHTREINLTCFSIIVMYVFVELRPTFLIQEQAELKRLLSMSSHYNELGEMMRQKESHYRTSKRSEDRLADETK